jgi:hypothetical protein
MVEAGFEPDSDRNLDTVRADPFGSGAVGTRAVQLAKLRGTKVLALAAGESDDGVDINRAPDEVVGTQP